MKRFAFVLIILAACGGKSGSNPELAQAACDHELELGYWKGFDESIAKSGNDPKDATVHKMGEAALPEQRKSQAWKDALAECAKGFQAAATDSQLTCVKGATSVDDAQACLK